MYILLHQTVLWSKKTQKIYGSEQVQKENLGGVVEKIEQKMVMWPIIGVILR